MRAVEELKGTAADRKTGTMDSQAKGLQLVAAAFQSNLDCSGGSMKLLVKVVSVFGTMIIRLRWKRR